MSVSNVEDVRANIRGTVQIVERLGNATIMYVDTSAGQIVVQADGASNTEAGQTVGVIFDVAHAHVFGANQEAL